nr:olfactory receptor 7E24-like [Pan paniscus]
MSSSPTLDVSNEITEGLYTPCDIGSNMILSPPGYWERYDSAEDPELQPVLALLSLSLSLNLVTVLRNLLSILAVSSDSPLHTPMYFFLSNLCWADIGFTLAKVPKVIVYMPAHSRVISHVGCLTQMSFLLLFACIEGMLLTVMAYGCFVAICRPLHSPVIVNPHLCVFFVLVSFFLNLLDSQLHSWIVLQFTIIENVEISNFFCDPSQLLNLACSDSIINSIFIYFDSTMFGFLPISGILLSYYKIVPSILRMSSSDGKYKAFSTYGSHLAVVCWFYGTVIGMYLASAVSPPPRNGVVASVMYAVVTPMLNLFIYSLRNRDIQSALRRLHSRTVESHDLFHPFSCVGEKGQPH